MDDVRGLLDRLRSRVGADVLQYLEIVDDEVVVRVLVGDAEAYGLAVGQHLPLHELPELRPDRSVTAVLSRDDASAMRLPGALGGLTRPPRAYLGTPVLLGTGQPAGLLCALYRRPAPHLNARDLDAMTFAAELLGPELVESGQDSVLRRRMRERLRAVMNGGMRMVHQPIVDLASGRATMIEALARFDALPARPPNLWFAEAARLGLGVDLELAAIRLALAHLVDLPTGGRLALNVSVDTLLSGGVHELLDPSVADRIVLEVTETTVVPSYDELLEVFASLRARGTWLAVDDLGAGFAGLSHLTGLRPEVVKIDRSIVEHVGSDAHHDALITALVDFAASTGATLVGEGIETVEQLRSLMTLGVSHGQGYLFAVPDRVDRLRPRYHVATSVPTRDPGATEVTASCLVS